MIVIMNPPYGKSSSLSKKILNKIHESGIASEIVCLAPPKTFYDKLAFVKSADHISGLDNFGDMGYDNLNLCHLLLVEQNIYKEPADFLLSEKMSILRNAVLKYNKSKRPFFENVNFKKWIGDDSLLFVVPIYTPSPNTGVAFAGQSWVHNVEKQPIEKDKPNYPYMMKFNSQIEYDNFSKWWYGSGRRKEKNLLNFCFDILYRLYGGDPSLNKYVEVLPNLDWSHEWTDEEILKEIGLSEDFLAE